ncbi:uncharacterized protein LOC129963850 [Argiope bruennichi]|uniref:PAXIP1-associated glutamate-rich protein 1 n=1 Tax=Argiope bruennichi TaxID=94029 RepID=A0A8T0EWS3_ARGBR|nr:uncharacterized protein LOC129963850 [Argiope bruennichi]KAF8782540.1 hypothetical protein HNY73_012809 [Argiope bruennichi]
MADPGDDENMERPEGAEGGHSSSDELGYELVEEEELIDTVWEASEVHPKREFPRIGFGRGGEHPDVPPPRVRLTDRPTRASSSTAAQTDEPSEEQERPQAEGGQASAPAPEEEPKQKVPLKRRISQSLQRMRFRRSGGDSPEKRKQKEKKNDS